MYRSMMRGNKLKEGISPWNKGLTGIKTGKKGPRPHVTPWNYKGGTGTARHQAMGTLGYKSWRSKVFDRDNYTCQVCEQYGGTLHADHINKWSDNEELRYNVDNGRTLCVPCHYYITFKRKMKPGQRWCNFTAKKEG
jgi:5-methylcytosine-specific restriction endonuclease McrA